jgi:glycosyltransferase involved in cell wall biosynthesis
MAADFSRWAVVAHKDDTGFGRQAGDLMRVLGFGRHVVIPSERLVDHPLDPATDVWLAPDASVESVERSLSACEGIVFFERPGWHRELLPVARRLGVHIVAVPNWEWFDGRNPLWRLCDLFVCVNDFCAEVVSGFGFTNIHRLDWPVDLQTLPARSVRGPARLFVHNAGIVDPQDRKGTAETILAFARVRRDDVRLIVRLQKPAELPAADSRVSIEVGNLSSHADLYREGDCAIQPSKMEGIGFMVLEPWACGMPVITLNYPPMNEIVTQPEMLIRRRWFRRKAFPTAWIPHAHLRLPDIADLARRIEWAASNDLGGISSANRAAAEMRLCPERLLSSWLRALAP